MTLCDRPSLTFCANPLRSTQRRITYGNMLSTVRFHISRAVADALHISKIKRRARQTSVTDVRLDADEKKGGSGEVRVTCSIAMAIFLVGELKQVAERAKVQGNNNLVAGCSRAVTAAIKAIDDADASSKKPAARPSAIAPIA